MRLDERLALLDELARAWPGSQQFAVAVEAAAVGGGYAADEVGQQLRRIVEPVTADALRGQLTRELGDAALLESAGSERVVAPRELLHLVGDAVPGLLVESLLYTLALGCRQQVRVPAGDHVTPAFLDLARREAPALAQLVRVVDEVEWHRADAAVVMGTDDTIALVRARLGQTAPIAAFGERTGVRVVTAAGERAQPGWRDRGDDRFAGCMTPAVDIRIGAPEDDSLDARIERRRAADAQALGATAALPTVTVVASNDELRARLDSLGRWRLQTAVLVCGRNEWQPLASLLVDAGCTRVVPPGDAHLPSPRWRHDGRGRYVDLVRWVRIEAPG